MLTAVVLAVLIPLWVVLVTSLSSRETINAAGGLVRRSPRDIDLSAYRIIFSGGQITQALLVSTLVTVVGTALSLVADGAGRVRAVPARLGGCTAGCCSTSC